MELYKTGRSEESKPVYLIFNCTIERFGGGQMKMVGTCSVGVRDSKNGFGMSAPPGEK